MAMFELGAFIFCGALHFSAESVVCLLNLKCFPFFVVVILKQKCSDCKILANKVIPMSSTWRVLTEPVGNSVLFYAEVCTGSTSVVTVK